MKFLFINVLYIPYSLAYIVLSFYTFSKNEKDCFFECLSNNNIYTYLKIGSPPQSIPAFIMPNEYLLNIFNYICEIKTNFIVEQSKTYKSINYEVQYLTNITISYLITDRFEFVFNETNKKQYVEPIYYHYRPYNNTDKYKEKKYPYTCAYIGLKIPKYSSESSSKNLMLQLKQLRAINKHCFFIMYDNTDNDKGKMVIGEYPDKYNPNNFKSYQLKTIYALDLQSNYNWHLKFNSIYFKNNDKNISLNNYDSIIDLSSGLIFSTEEYINIIYSHFFENNIKKGLCEEKITNENIKYFICKSLEVIQSFPTLYMRHTLLVYTFELNYNDLFKKMNDEYVFLICYDKKNKNEWKFGKPLLKKYLFFYNYDEKFIGFYNPLIDIDGSLIEEKQENIQTINYSKSIIYVVILILIVFILFFMISRRIYRKKQNNIIFPNNNKSKIQELIYTNFDKDKTLNNNFP